MSARDATAGTTALQAIARCATATGRAAPDDALRAARRCVIDWLGVAIAGMAEEAPRQVARAMGLRDTAGPLGSPALPAFADALVMGTAGHVLDYDDTDYVNLVHVSASVVPALVAVARRHHVAGATLLRAMVAGYEVEATLGRRLGRSLTAQGWHVSGVLGHAGAASAAAIALDLSAERCAQAIAIALTGSSGLIAAFGTMAKSLQLGRTAGNGVLAAELAARGYTGPLGVLDTGAGLAGTYTGAAVTWDDIDARWGAPFAVLANSFKPHAACMITHPAIDAAMALRDDLAREGQDAAAIESVTCHVNVLTPKVAGHAIPASGLQGKFSVAYCVAAGLVDGRATPDVFTDDAVRRPAIVRLLAHTDIVADPAIGEQQAEVAIRLRDGRVLRRRTEIAKGNSAHPLSDDELGAKFVALARGRVRGDAQALRDLLWRLDGEPDAGRALAPYID